MYVCMYVYGRPCLVSVWRWKNMCMCSPKRKITHKLRVLLCVAVSDFFVENCRQRSEWFKTRAWVRVRMSECEHAICCRKHYQLIPPIHFNVNIFSSRVWLGRSALALAIRNRFPGSARVWVKDKILFCDGLSARYKSLLWGSEWDKSHSFLFLWRLNFTCIAPCTRDLNSIPIIKYHRSLSHTICIMI